MVKQIKISPVTRIEGHAQVTIDLDDSNKVTDARLNIMEVRGFEKFLQGRPVEEAPRIVTQICGICPVSHHLAGAKAVDGCFGVKAAPTAHMLRELMQMGQFIHSHSLHFYFLAAPDFVFTPDGECRPEERLRRPRRQPGAGHRGRAVQEDRHSRSSRPPQAGPSTRSPRCPAASPRA